MDEPEGCATDRVVNHLLTERAVTREELEAALEADEGEAAAEKRHVGRVVADPAVPG